MRLLNDLFATAMRWIFENYPDVPDQKTLAVRTGITETTLSRIANDKVKKPSALTIKRLMQAFEGVFNPDYFIGRSTTMLMADLIYLREKEANEPVTEKQPEFNQFLPDWADSLIQLASDNATAIQELKASNLQLRTLLEDVIAENKELRELLFKTTHGVKPSNRKIKYPTYDESIPMSGELPVAAEPKNN